MTISETVTTRPNLNAALQSARWYIRCVDCLTVGVILDNPTPALLSTLLCGACEGKIESMGRVHAINNEKHLVEDATKCVCDERCTNAQGPKCDCGCGGENHGTRRIVHIVRDLGVAPKCTFPDPDKSYAIAVEYREAREKLQALYATYQERKRKGEYLRGTEYTRYVELYRAVRKIVELRTHASRMKLFAKLTAAPAVTPQPSLGGL
jgi:hypothetical protein